MKKLSVLFVAIFLLTIAVNAQEFKKFRLAVGLGYAMPGGEGSGGGVLWDTEPSYRVTDALAVGLRVEGALIVRGFSKSIDNYSGDIAGISSYTLNGIYYLSNEKFRPYVGAGAGIYSLAAVTLSGDGGGAASESKIGFYPRIGFDLGHFNVNIDYNIVGTTEAQGFDTNDKYEIKNSYLGIRIGAFFFGGRN